MSNPVIETIQTNKYKSISLSIDFGTTKTISNIASRSLLSALLEVSSQKYPTQQKINDALSKIFGATFNIQTINVGRTHHIRFNIEFANISFFENEKKTLQMAIDFLREVIFSPYLEEKEKRFNQTLFNLERKNLITYLKSIEDDKNRYSLQRIRNSYFVDEAMKLPSYSTSTSVGKVTNADVYQTYKKMISEDDVLILAIGDIDENELKKYFEDWPFSNSNLQTANVFYQQGLQPVIQTEHVAEAVEQEKLLQIYQLQLPKQGLQRFSAMIFNRIFGEGDQSKLFLIVREQEQLAYAIGSVFNHFEGTLLTRAMIDPSKKEKTLALINEELLSIVDGRFDDEILQTVKLGLHHDFDALLDSNVAQKQRRLTALIAGFDQLEDSQWHEQIEKVTKEDVITIAKQVRLQTTFTLEPKKNENNTKHISKN